MRLKSVYYDNYKLLVATNHILVTAELMDTSETYCFTDHE